MLFFFVLLFLVVGLLPPLIDLEGEGIGYLLLLPVELEVALDGTEFHPVVVLLYGDVY